MNLRIPFYKVLADIETKDGNSHTVLIGLTLRKPKVNDHYIDFRESIRKYPGFGAFRYPTVNSRDAVARFRIDEIESYSVYFRRCHLFDWLEWWPILIVTTR